MILRDPSLRPGGGVIRSGHSRSHIYDPRKILTAGLPADEEENKLKQKLQAKLKNRKGFTLIEMLVVVAIIAILVAVSIPLVTGALDKARVATDQANERAAKAAVTIDYLLNDETYKNEKTVYFNAETGEVQVARPAVGYGQCSEHKGQLLKITFSGTGDELKYTMKWVNTDGATSSEKETHGIDGDIDGAP